MRIRKRWPPLSLPPPPPPPPPPPSPQRPDLPSSDSPELRHRHDRSPEDKENPQEKEEENQRRRSDLQLVTVRRTDGWIYSASDDDVDVKKIDSISMHLSFNEDPPIRAGEEAAAESRLTAANRRFGYIPSPETPAGVEIGHWCEEDRAIPLKKRRLSFETKASEELIMEKEKEGMAKVRARRKRKRKWVESEDDNEEEKDEQDGIAMKKRERRSRKMDGSRCSRVNGRGWRCCEQTLVGYSLCEHHLGKGRVRSMSSVRSRNLSTAPTDKPKKVETRCSFNEEDEEDDDEVDKGIAGVKKRKKIGVVKARSMSSLLGQTVPLPPVTLLPPCNDNDDSMMI